jgi:branched-chain amino acid transport system ATP-binding protein
VIDAYLGQADDLAPRAARPPAGRAVVLSVDGLAVERGGVSVLAGVRLAVREREILAVIGPNGAGKSTLLGSLAGLLPARGGAARFDGVDVLGQRAERLAGRGLALVPERRQVFEGLSVRENLLLGGYRRAGWLARWRRCPRALEADLAAVLRLFPRLAALQRIRAGALSGGEQQMLAVARALMARPRLLMLDEPSLGLAPKIVAEILLVLARLRDEGAAILLVEQNARAALRVADRVAVLGRGTIELDGDAEDLARDARIRRAYLGARTEPGPLTISAREA